jgi:hypothetical protein
LVSDEEDGPETGNTLCPNITESIITLLNVIDKHEEKSTPHATYTKYCHKKTLKISFFCAILVKRPFLI